MLIYNYLYFQSKTSSIIISLDISKKENRIALLSNKNEIALYNITSNNTNNNNQSLQQEKKFIIEHYPISSVHFSNKNNNELLLGATNECM